MVYRTLEPHCPRCTVPLQATMALWIERHSCPRCHGHLITHEQLTEVARIIDVPIDTLERDALPGVSELPCPTCRTPMLRLSVGRLPGVPIDRCATHGVWFDAHELDHTLSALGADVEDRGGDPWPAGGARRPGLVARLRALLGLRPW